MPFPTPILRDDAYPQYKSQYGPKYHYQPNIKGFTLRQGVGLGVTSGAFGAVALLAVIYYASGIPRLQRDVLYKIPGVEKYYEKDIPASDNPF